MTTQHNDKTASNPRKNCEECGWPQDVCCCESVTHPDNPTYVWRCAECGGDHEPTGARYDCILHWKRRAIVAENLVNVVKHYGPLPLGIERPHILDAKSAMAAVTSQRDELLEVLQETVKSLEWSLMVIEDIPAERVLSHMLNRARAAIAKAVTFCQ